MKHTSKPITKNKTINEIIEFQINEIIETFRNIKDTTFLVLLNFNHKIFFVLK